MDETPLYLKLEELYGFLRENKKTDSDFWVNLYGKVISVVKEVNISTEQLELYLEFMSQVRSELERYNDMEPVVLNLNGWLRMKGILPQRETPPPKE